MPTIIELQDEPDVTRAFPLMSQLRDRIHADTFVAEVRRQQADGYQLIAAIDGDRIVGLAGIRRSHTLSRGPHLFVDDLVTDDTLRGRGVGRALMVWVEGLARAEGLPRIYLDSRATAQGFYEKLGFTFLTAVPSWKDVAGTA